MGLSYLARLLGDGLESRAYITLAWMLSKNLDKALRLCKPIYSVFKETVVGEHELGSG